MKRTPLTRSTPLRRHRGVRKVNRKRKAKRLAEAFGPQSKLCREQPCCVCKRLGTKQIFPTEPHHWPTRARGGVDRDTMPVCSAHHQELHAAGHERYFVDLGLPWWEVTARMRRMVADAEHDDLPVSPLLHWLGVGE